MKVIDHTPYFSPEGKISAIDQARASMKMGGVWVQETRAQKDVMNVLERGLDKKFTLLRNVTLSGLEISIPFILIGPSGIYALYVTALKGMYRAKGDVWGTLSGDSIKPSSANLLTRTARMARAVQVYLERQGFGGYGAVDAALLCADPGMHVDSVRPIVRVVQSDALERFADSLAQGRGVLSPEAVADVVNRILNPKSPKAPEPPAVPASLVPESESTPEPTPEAEPYVPTFALPAEESSAPAAAATGLGFDFHEEAAPTDETPFGAVPPAPAAPARKAARTARRGFSSRQWVVLVLFAVVECIAVLVFAYLVMMQNR